MSAQATRKALLLLIAGVLLVDLVFIGLYYAAGLRHATGAVKIGFTAAWTGVTLAVVLLGLTRVRQARRDRP